MVTKEGDTMSKFYAIESTYEGEISENTNYSALGRAGRDKIREPEEREMSIVPYGTDVNFLPQRDPVGMAKGRKTSWFKTGDEKVCAVALIPPIGYTRTLLPAYQIKKNIEMPFFAYTMGAFKDGEIYIAAIETDKSLRWDPSQYNGPDLEKKIKLKIKKYPKNRLLKHLSKCALEYGCWNAQNIFYDRWEGGIPVSESCNADCLGCISKKRKTKLQSPQNRITFSPTVEEIVEIAVPHLKMGRAIISFGQGCEGEPLTKSDLIASSISSIRKQTDKGTIHINTNGVLTNGLEKLIDAGLDSVRISMNSAVKETYDSYFHVGEHGFENMKKSVKLAKDKGLFVSINYLIMPGVNDNENEAKEFLKFIEEYKPDMIQTRNLNIDPEIYFSNMPTLKGKSLGIVNLLDEIKKIDDKVIIGNFNRALKD